MGTFIPLFNRHKMVGLAPHFTQKALFSSSLDWVVDNAARSKSARRKLTLRVAGLKQLPLYYLLWSGAQQLSSTLGNYSNNDGQTSREPPHYTLAQYKSVPTYPYQRVAATLPLIRYLNEN